MTDFSVCREPRTDAWLKPLDPGHSEVCVVAWRFFILTSVPERLGTSSSICALVSRTSTVSVIAGRDFHFFNFQFFHFFKPSVFNHPCLSMSVPSFHTIIPTSAECRLTILSRTHSLIRERHISRIAAARESRVALIDAPFTFSNLFFFSFGVSFGSISWESREFDHKGLDSAGSL